MNDTQILKFFFLKVSTYLLVVDCVTSQRASPYNEGSLLDQSGTLQRDSPCQDT